MPKIQLVTDVSQWGLLTWPAATRTRLVTTALGTTLLTLGIARLSAGFIMEISSSVLLNLFLISANMFVLLIAAFLQAALLGDLFFAGPWRERVFLGQRHLKPDHLDLTTVDDHNAEFIALIIVAILFNVFTLNLATNSFFSRYHDEGFFHVQMRSDNPDQRIAALTSIADPNNIRLWERDGLRDLIIDAFDDPSPTVRRQAIYTAGTLQVIAARPILQQLVLDPPDIASGAEAAFTLGRLGRDQRSRAVLERLITPSSPDEIRLGALRGLARMEDPRAVASVTEQIHDENPTIQAYAFWVLARMGSSLPAHEVRDIIETEPHGPRRCAALEAYKLVAPKEHAEFARLSFGHEAPENDCEAITFEELNERINYVVYGESARVKWLKVVGNTDPYQFRRWLRRLLADPDEETHIRDVAAEILRQMDRQ